MAKSTKPKVTKKGKPSQLYSIISIALVLFLIGLLGLLALNAQAISNYFKENFQVSVILNEQLKEAEILQLRQDLASKNYACVVDFVSKNEAKEIFEKSYGEGFDEVLGYNPLFASLEIGLNADYANTDSLAQIKQSLEKNGQVQEVYYQQNIIELVNKNFRVIGIVLGIVSILFLLIAFTLIDNTIRLMMYSKRFLVKSMQLVGATRSFITKPFLKQSISNGLLAALLAICLLAAILLLMQFNFPEIYVLRDLIRFVIVCALIIGLGILISWFSTRRSVSKYIKMKLDDLY